MSRVGVTELTYAILLMSTRQKIMLNEAHLLAFILILLITSLILYNVNPYGKCCVNEIINAAELCLLH